MDEESVGIFGVLLIVTVLVMSQAAPFRSAATPVLAGINWGSVSSVFGCDEKPGDSCYVAMTQ